MKIILLSLLASFAMTQPITIELDRAPRSPKPKPKWDGPVFLDARPTFEYAMSHLEKAQAMRWEDFSQTEEPHRGALDPDNKLLARKLRIFGIMPAREVVVIGNGAKGNGEEGRLAWMLAYMGVRQIQVLNINNMPDAKKVSGQRYAVDAAPIWLPKVNSQIKIHKRDLAKLVQEKLGNFILIDVRSPEEFQGKKTSGEKRPGHLPGAINVHWQRFIGANGEMATPEEVEKVLKESGINAKKDLIFYSSNGVSSGYATYAALRAGLSAKNFDGGYIEWSADDALPVTANP